MKVLDLTIKPFSWLLILSVMLLSACTGGGGGKEIDNPTRGKIPVVIDDSYRLLMDAQLYTFKALYKYADFDTLIRTETDALDLFMKDSVPLMITNRKLTDNEVQLLRNKQIIPKTTVIAYDAVAFIVNKANPDSNLLFDHIRDIFQGKKSTWSDLNPRGQAKPVKVIFDHFKSGNPRYFKDKFGIDSLPPVCFAVNSNEEVVKFVERNVEALGVISVNWISDNQDTVSNRFLGKIRVVGVSSEGATREDASYYKPYQAYIAEGLYPFTREVYCINRQTYSGLAYGLSAFIAGEKGQLIVLHSGLVPATMPVRIVEIKK